MVNGGGTGNPCGACKFLRRKCAADCIFAPYFCSEQGPARFAAIHKVFGASNLSKLLLHVPVPDRSEAVVTIAYEAQARMNDPVYGCVSHIYALQQQVAFLQAQLMQVKARLAQRILDASRCGGNQMTNSLCASAISSSSSYNLVNPACYDFNCISPQSSICKLESIEPDGHGFSMQEMTGGSDGFWLQGNDKKKMFLSQQTNDLGELQALAFRMMKN